MMICSIRLGVLFRLGVIKGHCVGRWNRINFDMVGGLSRQLCIDLESFWLIFEQMSRNKSSKQVDKVTPIN